MKPEIGMYLYPWAVRDMATFREEYAATGCNSMSVALAYHHGNILYPREGGLRLNEEAAVSFTPDGGLYGELLPAVYGETARADTARRLRDWCGETERSFCAWTVLLHNRTMGVRHPRLTVENLWGDRYAHALCPSNPEVWDYSRALLTDICNQFRPDSLMAEAATAMPAMYCTTDIANVQVGLAARWLLSLCFCPHCMERAQAGGVDAAAARAQAKGLLGRLLGSETACGDNGAAQLAMLLMEYPLLYAYGGQRGEGVRCYVAQVSALLRERGVEFKLIPSAVPFDINLALLEGTGFSRLSGLADVLLPLVYGKGERYSTVLSNIRLADEVTPVGMATSLHPALHPDRGSLLAAVADAKEGGCTCLNLYNFSIASKERLSWVARTAEQFL